MKALVGVLALVAVVGAVAFYGCGPRGAVAKDKIVAQIDKLLGELDVKKKKIEQEYAKLKTDIENVRERRINTEVRLEQLTLKKKNAEGKITEIKGKMTALQALVKKATESESKSVENNGATWSAEQLNKASAELVAEYQAAEKELNSNLKTSIDAMTRSLDFLKKQEDAGKQMVVQIETKMQEIDARKIAMDAVKNATDLAGNESSITEKYGALSKEIEDLFVDVETAMRKEEENLQDLQSNTSIADEILAEPADLNSTLNQLNAILGNSGS